MMLLIKDTVRFWFINDMVFQVFYVVEKVVSAAGKLVIVTSAADGEHMEGSYHPDGYAWDFDVVNGNISNAEFKEIKLTLKTLDQFFDVVLENDKGNEHLHVEYDTRRKAKYSKPSTSKAVEGNTKITSGGVNMGKTLEGLLKLVATVLSPVVSAITKKYRDDIDKWIREKYADALKTDNPWDDFLFSVLATLLKVDISDLKKE